MNKTEQFETDVLVIGGGASGTMAAIQAARMGVNVILVEETEWLGGMLTAAGVSAIDGNHRLPGGLWGEFRQKLYTHYGGPDSVETGWVSNTLFEPHIGERYLRELVDAEPTIRVIHGYWAVDALMDDKRILGGLFQNEQGDRLEIRAPVTIAAEEYGDFLKHAHIPYRFGFEARAESGDEPAPEQAWPHIQDLTYVAILKDYGAGTDKTLPEPEGYDAADFDCTCKQLCSDAAVNVVDCGPESGKDLYMFNYGELPNALFMINWPIKGNDYYIPILEMSREERVLALEEAKNATLRWIHFIQTEGGYASMGIAEGIFPTSDHLPLIPYIRESRRIYGMVTLTMNDIKNPYTAPSGNLYQTAIAVGDYPLDLHHERKPDSLHSAVTTESLPKIPSYSVPYGTMLPEGFKGIIVAEKSISVTHIVNGATRLQPVVMLLGQAAGAAAALSVINETDPDALNIREIQQRLLDAGTWLLPFADTNPSEGDFQAIQRVALNGWMRGTGEPSAWANRTWFYPDSVLTGRMIDETASWIAASGWPHQKSVQVNRTAIITRAQAAQIAWELAGSPVYSGPKNKFSDIWATHRNSDAIYWLDRIRAIPAWTDSGRYLPRQRVTRREFARILDRALDPFDTIETGIRP